MRQEQQLKTFLRILADYENDTPLAKFLPVFFRANKQMGSTDRRVASRLLYNYFRLGKACAVLKPEERLFIAEFLCNNSPDAFLEHFSPELNAKAGLSLDDRMAYVQQHYGFKPEDVFPFTSHLSEGIDIPEFLKSFFVQPDLFIRIHPGKEKLVKLRLEDEQISYVEETPLSIRLPNGTKLDQLFPEQALFEVQDLSSQQTGQYFKPHKWDYWWDSCAASGGKSLLLFHQQPEINLLVSDIRESVLSNLDERFSNAGLRKYHKKIIDLTKNPDPDLHDYAFDGIILDAPCSGSGTWGRSPEMISQFREGRIKSFQNLQRSVSANVVKYLKAGKALIYITCSAFKEENEQNAEFMAANFNLEIEDQLLLNGYTRKADTMFVTRLLKK